MTFKEDRKQRYNLKLLVILSLYQYLTNTLTYVLLRTKSKNYNFTWIIPFSIHSMTSFIHSHDGNSPDCFISSISPAHSIITRIKASTWSMVLSEWNSSRTRPCSLGTTG